MLEAKCTRDNGGKILEDACMTMNANVSLKANFLRSQILCELRGERLHLDVA